jgi:aryl-alcohol dehydrogenase
LPLALFNVIQPGPDLTVVMIRTGVVGLAALMSLMVSGTPPQKIIVADIIPQRLEKAKVLGATNLINFRESPDLREAFVGYY